jgi:hypothetical protein
VDVEMIANILVEVKDSLESLAINYPGIEADPLFYDPVEKITIILEEIE